MIQAAKHKSGVLQPATAKLQEEFRKNEHKYKNQKELLVYHLSRLNQEVFSSRESSASSTSQSSKQRSKAEKEAVKMRESFLSPVLDTPSFSPKHGRRLAATKVDNRLYLPKIQPDMRIQNGSINDINLCLNELFNALEGPPLKRLPKINDPLRSEIQMTAGELKKHVTFKEDSFTSQTTSTKSVASQNNSDNSKEDSQVLAVPKKHHLPKLVLTDTDAPRRLKRHASMPSKLPAIKEKSFVGKKPKSKSPMNPQEAKVKAAKMKDRFSGLTDPEKRSAVLANILHSVHYTMVENKKKLGIPHKTVIPEIPPGRTSQASNSQVSNNGSKADIRSDSYKGSKNDMNKQEPQGDTQSRNETSSVMRRHNRKEELRDYLQQRSKSKLVT